MRSPWLRADVGVFLVLLGSYAFFWHSRDWNTASRLILTYAMVDRGTVCLDGLDRQTGDIAFYEGHYYCDKLPGYSLLAAVPYGLARVVLGLPPHPLDPPPKAPLAKNSPAKAFWPADYWVTLGTSGLCTAVTAVLLMRLARVIGCSPVRGVLVGLAYGLSTPAYVYATLAYGHQASACALFASFLLLSRRGAGRQIGTLLAAGSLAAYAAIIELQVGPVSAILGIYLLVQCLRGNRRPEALGYFAIGAAVPTVILLAYNTLAFGSPLEMGYFHHANAQFAKVHNRQNPLGLRTPDLRLVLPLLAGEHRGLLFYAPILLLAVPGWMVLAARRQFDLATVSLAAAAAIFLVNLSYPEWTGGWSNGPRLLVPLLPFAMVPVAALLSYRGRFSGLIKWVAAALAAGGGVLIFLFQGVGGRVPQDVLAPVRTVVWPIWTGRPSIPMWWTDQRFTATIRDVLASDWTEHLQIARQATQFVPLVVVQIAAIALVFWTASQTSSASHRPPSDLRIDQQEQDRGANQEAQAPEGKPKCVHPDPVP